MATEQPASFPAVLSNLPRVPSITITKNESQEYVISRPNRSDLSTPPVRFEGVSVQPSMSSAMSSAYSNCTYNDQSMMDSINTRCNYQPECSASLVGPANASSSKSYENIGNSSLNQATSSQNNYSVVSACSSYQSSTVCDYRNYSLSNSKDASDGYGNFVNCYSSNVPNDTNYRATTCASSTCANPINSTYASVNTYQTDQSATESSRFAFGFSNVSASAQNYHSRNIISDQAMTADPSIPFVDLTLPQNLRNCHNRSSNVTPSISNGNHQNVMACSSALSANLSDSSQVSSTVTERANASLISLNVNAYKLSNDSRHTFSGLLAEISKLMKNIHLNQYMNSCGETMNQMQAKEDNENLNYGMELYRFNLRCNYYNTPSSELLPAARKLFSLCNEHCQRYFLILYGKEQLNLHDEILIRNMKLFLINLINLLERGLLPVENSSNATKYEGAISSTSTFPLYGTTEVDGACSSRKNAAIASRDKLQKYEQQMEWQKAQIHYLEKKVKEKNRVENELEESKKTCAELEDKLKKKDAIGCWRQDNITEWCCELMSELKTTMLDLLENEFKCCICDELLIEPVVTNCHHIFCTLCLDTWRTKKKECPVCRATITNVYKVNAIDEFITAATSSLSDKAYAERLQVIEDRKNSNPPPAKKPNLSIGSALPLPSSLSLQQNAAVRMPRLPPPAHSSGPWPSSSQSSTIWRPPPLSEGTWPHLAANSHVSWIQPLRSLPVQEHLSRPSRGQNL